MDKLSSSPAAERRPPWHYVLAALILCAVYAGLAGGSLRWGPLEEAEASLKSAGIKPLRGAPSVHILPVLLAWWWLGPAGGVPCVLLSAGLLAASKDAPWEATWAAILVVPAVAAHLLRKNGEATRRRLREELDAALEKKASLTKEEKFERERADEMRRATEWFPPLREVGEKLLGVLSVAECASILVSESLRVIGRADTALLYLVDEASGNLMISEHKSRLTSFKVESIAGDDADRLVFLRGEPKLVERTADSEFQPKTKSRSVGSFVGAPVMIGERAGGVVRTKVLGVLRLDATEQGALGVQDQRLLGAIAELGARALHIARLHERTQQLAMRDSTTGLYVVSYFRERVREELARARRTGRPASLLMLDIDHFKRFNDQWGHPAGDEVLKGIAEVLASFARSGDIPCRYGGEELALLRLDPKGKAPEIAERIRERVRDMRFKAGAVVTVSIGVSGFPQDGDGVDDLVAAADRALYNAKRQGRDRVCIA